jgi:hypothetical protein
MAQVKVPLDTLGPLQLQLLGEASAALAPALEQLAGRFGPRAASLRQAATRLEGQLGGDHPEVAALRRAATAAATLEQAAHDTAASRAAVPAPTDGTWVVFGRVTRADGKPGARLKVQVSTAKDGSLRDAFDPATTGADGHFAAAYKRPNVAGDLPELTVTVEDAKGTVPIDAPPQLWFKAGTADYLQLVLAARPTRQAKASRKAAKPAAKRSGTSARRSRQRPSS